MNTLIDSIGLLGVFLYLLSYLLLQLKKISADNGYSYTVLNLFGAIFVLVSLTKDYNLASVVIQISWIIISLIGIYTIYTKAKIAKN